jgi:dihydroxynaphthoic acid synthetase
MTPDILTTEIGHIGHITLNRPGSLNAFRTQTVKEMAAILTQWSQDKSIGVVVITGASDKAFCAGADIAFMSTLTKEAGEEFANECVTLAKIIFKIPVPLIASINGFCLGGGHELNLLCDLSIASDQAIFGQTGAKVGMLPVWGSAQLLPRIIGEKKAREMVFLAERFSAEEALNLGLINKVVPHAQLEAETKKWCEQILTLSPQSLRQTKKCLNREWERLLPVFEEGAQLLGEAYQSEESQEGLAAFFEKRKPDFMKFRK